MKTQTRTLSFALLAIVTCTFATVPRSSSAANRATITVNNNSRREIVHLYTSPVDRNQWSEDYLPDGSRLQSGGSITLSSVITDRDQIKVIAEDKDGCFSYSVISCADAASWTIDNNTARDCGS